MMLTFQPGTRKDFRASSGSAITDNVALLVTKLNYRIAEDNPRIMWKHGCLRWQVTKLKLLNLFDKVDICQNSSKDIKSPIQFIQFVFTPLKPNCRRVRHEHDKSVTAFHPLFRSFFHSVPLPSIQSFIRSLVH